MKEVIKTGATVDLAIEEALKELSLDREQVTVEVLEYPEKKFFFKKPAKVKVTEVIDDFNVKELFYGKEEKNTNKKEEKNIKDNKPTKKETLPKQEVKKEQKQPQKVQEVKVEKQEIAQEDLSEKAKYAMEFLNSVIGEFYKGEYNLIPTKDEKGCVIKIVCQDAGVLIGKKGETMEALSYLTSLAANRNDESFEKISIDIGDYRKKREKDLQALAKRTAIKVSKTGRSYTFEPMNPYERRIIHAAVSEITGVKSESRGEGGSRRVSVISTSPRKPRSDKKNSYNDKKFDKKEPQVQKTRDEKLVDNAGAALYSKIEL